MSAGGQDYAEATLTLQRPDLGTGPVSTDIYHDPAVYTRELEAIFERSWIWVGRESQVREAGRFFVRDIPTFGHSVLVCRDKDGVLRGFFNACRHRGATVEKRESGSCSVFTCGFHGWSYDLSGALRGVPDSAGFHELPKGDLGLKPLPIEVWEGFVFVHLGETPECSLREFLGEQGEDLAGYPFDACEQRFAFSTEIATNWKCMVDSFCESYHLPILHRRGIGQTMAGPGNPTCRLVDVRLKGPHRTISLWANKAYQPSPVQALAYENAPGPAITSGRAESSFQMPKGLNQTRSETWSLDVTIFFPTFLIAMGTGMYFTHQIWPLASNRVRYEMRAYLRPAENAAQRFAQEHALVELRDTLLEDTNTLERIQGALDAGIVREFHFHDHELALRHHHHVVQQYLAGAS